MYSHALQPRERDKWSVVMVHRVSSSGGRIHGQICRSFSEKKKMEKSKLLQVGATWKKSFFFSKVLQKNTTE